MCPDELAPLEAHALAGHDLGDGHTCCQHRAQVPGRFGDGEGDGTHAALDVAPGHGDAFQLAQEVHELHERRARVVRAGPRPDDALPVEGPLEPLVAHVAVDDLGDRGLVEGLDHLRVVAQQLLQLGPLGSLAHPRVPAALAQGDAHAIEEVLVGELALDVGLAEAVGPHVGGRALGVLELGVAGPVLERAPDEGLGHEDLVAVITEAELGDDPLVEQADDVGTGADPVAVVGERGLQRAGATEALAGLEDQDRLPGLGQVGRRGQAVVATTDDDRIPVPGRQLGHGHREPDLAQGGVDVTGWHPGQPFRAVANVSRLARKTSTSSSVCWTDRVHCSHLPHGGRNTPPLCW